MLKGEKVCVEVHQNINGSCLFGCWHLGQFLVISGFLRWPSGSESACQCGRYKRLGFLDQEDPLEEEMATHSNNLAGKSHGQRSLAGCGPWGCTELDMTERTHTLKLFLCNFFLISICFTVGENIFKLILCF